MMRKAYSYIRFSSPKQALGDSYRRQNEAIENYCVNNNLELVKDSEYTFFDKGLSAYSGEHIGDKGQLARFLDCIKRGDIAKGSVLVVESLDRLSRDKVISALTQFLSIIEAGIDIVTLSDGMEYKAGAIEPMQLIISIFVMSRAHEESSLRAKRIKSVWEGKRIQARENFTAISPVCPLWLCVSDKKKYLVLEDRAEVVRRIFNMSINGYGRTAIASILNREEIKSFKGTTWGTSSIEKILNNRAVIGEYQPYTMSGLKKRQPEGEAIKGYYPEIVSESVFYAAKAAIEERRITQAKRQPAKFNIWSKVAVCAVCEANMVYIDKGDGAKGGKYLQCYETIKSKGRVCTNKRIRYEKAHEIFKRILTRIDSLSLVQDSSKKLEFELNSIKGALADAEKRHREHDSIYRENRSRTALAAADAALEEIDLLKQRLEEINKEIANAGIFDQENFLELLDLESYEGRNQANRLMHRLGVKVGIHIQADKATFYARGIAIFGLDKEGNIQEAPLNLDALKRSFFQNKEIMDSAKELGLTQEEHELLIHEAMLEYTTEAAAIAKQIIDNDS